MNVRMFALCGVVGLGLGACVDNGDNAPLRIIGNLAPGSGCTLDSSSSLFLDDGTIESSSLLGYVFTPSARNDLQTFENELTGPKTIYVTYARVDISFYDPDFEGVTNDASLLHFRVPISGSLEPNGGTAAFSFEIVPPELLELIGAQLGNPTTADPLRRTTLDVSVQLVASRGGGGGEEESNVFRYPVEVCNGCLLNNVGACTDLSSSFEARKGGECNAAQDGIVDCCTDSTGPVCPAAPPPSL